jgi:hypothetical protein
VNAPEAIAARLIGSLFVERGLVSESQLRVALELQRETGEQLGQILVSTFGVSRKELARVVADQWREMSGDAGADPERSARRRPLGEIFITRGFVSEEELDAALRRQRKTGERLGEALVGLGVISKFELAGALGEQMAELQEAADAEAAELAVVVDMPQREPEETTFGTLAEPDEPEGESHADGSYELLPENDAALEDEGPSPVVGRLEEALAPMRRDEADASDGSDSDVTWPTVASFDDFAEPERGVAEPDVAEPAPVADGIDDLIAAVAEPGSDHLAQDHLTSAADPRALDDAVCLAYISTPTGYRLVPLAVELPAPGESIELGELGQLVVSRVGKSPLPLDRRVCVYVEQPLAPASTLLPA